jgi:two-component system heavy metal sensor histidine kinase CusS
VHSNDPRRAPLSLAARLFLIYAVSAGAILVVATAFLYWILIRDIERDYLRYAVEKLRRVEWALINRPQDAGLLEHELSGREGDASFHVRILDERGRTLLESPPMAKLAPRESFPAPMASALLGTLRSLQHRRSPEGGSYCLLAVRSRNLLTGQSWVIQVALDSSERETLLANLRNGALAALLICALLCAGLGGFAARRGMKPLQDIAAAAERITVSQLSERIDPAHWPGELGMLAGALNRMLARLEDGFRRMSQCTADLAHELRTPIQNLMGEAGVALVAERNPEEYRRVLESSLEEYARLSRMINEMLFLARAENPQQQIGRERLDARRELEAVKEFFEALSDAHGVTVTCEGEAELVADPLLFRRAVTNLLSNALRHTPREGRISLAVQRAGDGSLRIKVADSGCGIAAERLPRICERRYTTDPGGTQSGLGLSIVKSIVELHGGSLEIASAPGKGTSVLLRFPATCLPRQAVPILAAAGELQKL